MHSYTSRLYINSLLSLLSIFLFFLLFDVDFELGLDKLLINFDVFFFFCFQGLVGTAKESCGCSDHELDGGRP